ncbi:hypothetical protein [Wenzhouxiangella sediminis]|uniref:Secreted protein n=1 Tax=Wenzhouxiangella sediminis TaxID=1792836 RepID=A0A3E1KAX1_9GAMM|nr:hypothetical protein [Wenzhouxiangella sediminis]RFF31596.1 hypothetical protein DZC52_04350 [Wenzhouxiangella sediminis]
MPKPLTVILAALICCACNDTTSTATDNDETDESERAKTGYEQSLERAREVEDEVLEAAEKQKEAIEEQTGDG